MTVDEKKQFVKMQDKIDTIEDKVNEILNILRGDDMGHNQGLVKDVKEQKERIKKVEILKDRIIWIITGAGVAGGFALDKIIDFLKKVLPVILITLTLIII